MQYTPDIKLKRKYEHALLNESENPAKRHKLPRSKVPTLSELAAVMSTVTESPRAEYMANRLVETLMPKITAHKSFPAPELRKIHLLEKNSEALSIGLKRLSWTVEEINGLHTRKQEIRTLCKYSRRITPQMRDCIEHFMHDLRLLQFKTKDSLNDDRSDWYYMEVQLNASPEKQHKRYRKAILDTTSFSSDIASTIASLLLVPEWRIRGGTDDHCFYAITPPKNQQFGIHTHKALLNLRAELGYNCLLIPDKIWCPIVDWLLTFEHDSALNDWQEGVNFKSICPRLNGFGKHGPKFGDKDSDDDEENEGDEEEEDEPEEEEEEEEDDDDDDEREEKRLTTADLGCVIL